MNQAKVDKIDRIVKSKLEVLNFSPPPESNWDKNVSWKIIKNKLASSNKTLVVWGFSVAASISMLIAANITWEMGLVVDPSETIQEQSVILIAPEQKVIKPQPSAKEIIEMKKIKSVYSDNVISSTNSVNENSVIEPAFQPVTPLGQLKYVQLISPYFSIHTGTSGTYPNVGFDFKMYSKRKNKINHLMKLGVSTDFQRITNETSTKVFPLTFINVGYSRVNEFTEKGWSTQVGYMINPDSYVYKNKTVKFSLTKRFSRHLKAGPEIIFTNNFRKVYPGITIVLS